MSGAGHIFLFRLADSKTHFPLEKTLKKTEFLGGQKTSIILTWGRKRFDKSRENGKSWLWNRKSASADPLRLSNISDQIFIQHKQQQGWVVKIVKFLMSHDVISLFLYGR